MVNANLMLMRTSTKMIVESPEKKDSMKRNLCKQKSTYTSADRHQQTTPTNVPAMLK